MLVSEPTCALHPQTSRFVPSNANAISSRPLAHLRHHGMECEDCEDSKDRKGCNILARAIVAVRACSLIHAEGRRSSRRSSKRSDKRISRGLNTAGLARRRMSMELAFQGRRLLERLKHSLRRSPYAPNAGIKKIFVESARAISRDADVGGRSTKKPKSKGLRSVAKTPRGCSP